MQQHRPRVSPDHDEDFFAWTQHQAKLLRALKRVEDPRGLDLLHIAEEVEGLGSADLNAVRSLIRQILVHLIKAASDKQNMADRHWRSEIFTFQSDIADRYTPSMRQLIEMQAIWRRALRGAELSLQEHGSELARMPAECPFEVIDFVQDEFDFDAALKKVAPDRL